MLKRLALAGFAFSFFSAFYRSMPLDSDASGIGLACLVPTALFVVFFFRLLLPEAHGPLGRFDLLTPLGLYFLADLVLEFALHTPLAYFLEPTWDFTIFSLTASLSFGLIYSIAIATMLCSWLTILILDVVDDVPLDLDGSVERARAKFFRVLGTIVIGWGVAFALLIMILPFFAAGGEVALVLLVILVLLWNFMTAAVLPTMVSSPKPFGAAFREGLRLSWRHKGKWAGALIVQHIYTGIFVYYSVTQTTGNSYHHNSGVDINVVWLGGYSGDVKWYEVLCLQSGLEPLPLFTLLLSIVAYVFAIGLKIAIVSRLKKAERGAEMVGTLGSRSEQGGDIDDTSALGEDGDLRR